MPIESAEPSRLTHCGTEPSVVTLQNEHLSATVVPALGGKVISLVRRPSNHEFLLAGDEADNRRRPSYGDNFEDPMPSGIDECFPTVQACGYPGAILTIRLPDHGELWSVPWDFDHRKDVLSLSAFSRQLQYRFVKTLRLEKSDLVIDYTVENHGAEPLKYLWSIHPLLRAETGDRIILPHDVKEVVVNWSHRERLGPAGTVCEWPLARLPDGASEDLGIVKSIEAGSADKLFSRRLQTGYCALYSPSSDESIGFRFDPEQIPFLGMWLCYGGWPATQPGRHHTIALEPCSGDTDSLEEASTRGQCEPLPPRQSRCWSLRLELREGLPQV